MNRSHPLCIAHRGFSATCPENTYAAFEAALAESIDAIETDVQLTHDGEPVVYHDRTLKLIGGGRRLMRGRTLEQAKSLDYGAWKDSRFVGQPLPTLDELLARLGRRTQWLLEIKRRELPWRRDRLELLMRRTIERVLAQGLEDQVVLLCYDLDLLAFGHGLCGRLRFAWNQDWPARFAADADFLHAYSLHHPAVSEALVTRIHEAGKPVWTFTVDDEPTLRQVTAAGVDGVMANDPRWLSAQLKIEPRRSSKGDN
jgi:glycerophosphoryl diester phosphodiesterase